MVSQRFDSNGGGEGGKAQMDGLCGGAVLCYCVIGCAWTVAASQEINELPFVWTSSREYFLN